MSEKEQKKKEKELKNMADEIRDSDKNPNMQRQPENGNQAARNESGGKDSDVRNSQGRMPVDREITIIRIPIRITGRIRDITGMISAEGAETVTIIIRTRIMGICLRGIPMLIREVISRGITPLREEMQAPVTTAGKRKRVRGKRCFGAYASVLF